MNVETRSCASSLRPVLLLGMGRVCHPLAAAAGLLEPRDLHDLQLRRDQTEHLAGVSSNQAQVSTAKNK